jgi:hypothetical protein
LLDGWRPEKKPRGAKNVQEPDSRKVTAALTVQKWYSVRHGVLPHRPMRESPHRAPALCLCRFQHTPVLIIVILVIEGVLWKLISDERQLIVDFIYGGFQECLASSV